jgi:hypothetical protein
MQTQQSDKPAEGFDIAGNFGDGKWRCIRTASPQTYIGNPQKTYEAAIAETWRLFDVLARLQTRAGEG